MSQIDVSPGTTTLATTYTWLSAAIECRQHREVTLYGDFTHGSATLLTLRFDSSPDGNDWYPILDPETGEPLEEPFDATELYDDDAFCLPVQVPSHNNLRVRAKVDSITGAPALSLGFLGDGALL